MIPLPLPPHPHREAPTASHGIPRTTHYHHPTHTTNMKPEYVAYLSLLIATLLLGIGVYLFATTPVTPMG